MEALSAPSSQVLNYFDQAQGGAGSQDQFKLMLVHDGYRHLDQAIDDLRRCGLPSHAEVLLLSIGELFRAPLHLAGSDAGMAQFSRSIRIHNRRSYRKPRSYSAEFDPAKREARAKLVAAFPHWNITFRQPLDWQPDLIFLGADQQSSARNPGLREIIRKMTAESNAPLRVARPRSQNGLSRGAAIIAFDGTASAAAVLTALQRRPTDRGGEIRLMFYMDPLMTQARRWSASYEEPDREWIDSQLVRTKTAIEALGYKVSCSKVAGNTAQAILNEAQRIDAESILLGTGPLQGLASLSAQSVAVTVAAEAECSVELACSGSPERPAAALQAMASSQTMAAWKGRTNPSPGTVASW